jgi:hypothetical protein
VLPGIAVLARNPDFAAPLVHPVENLLSMKRVFNVVTRLAKNFQLLGGRYKMDHFLAALFLLESTSEPMVKASEKVSLQILNLTPPSIHPIERPRNRLQNALPHFSYQDFVVIERSL